VVGVTRVEVHVQFPAQDTDAPIDDAWFGRVATGLDEALEGQLELGTVKGPVMRVGVLIGKREVSFRSRHVSVVPSEFTVMGVICVGGGANEHRADEEGGQDEGSSGFHFHSP